MKYGLCIQKPKWNIIIPCFYFNIVTITLQTDILDIQYMMVLYENCVSTKSPNGCSIYG